LPIGTRGEAGELCFLPPHVAWSAVVAIREVAPDGSHVRSESSHSSGENNVS
jgi:hypothetical protein